MAMAKRTEAKVCLLKNMMLMFNECGLLWVVASEGSIEVKKIWYEV